MRLWPFGPKKPKPESIPAMAGESPVPVIANATAPVGKAEDPLDERPGLRAGFQPGELLSWKGIWFRVARVDPASMVIIPQAMTAKRAKRVEAARGA